jgi:RHS repeat-associated protein
VGRVACRTLPSFLLTLFSSFTESLSDFSWTDPLLRRGAVLVCVLAIAVPVLADTTSSIPANFNGTAIAGGDTIWFTSVLKPSGLGSTPVTIFFRKSTVIFTANGTSYTVPAPDSNITFSPSATSATISFDSTKNLWQITVPSSGLAGNTMLGAVQFVVPAGGLPGGIQNVKWQANFSTDTSGISVQWQWAAAVYTSFGASYSSLGVKPVDDNKASQYQNSDHAGTPENYKTYVAGGATGGGGSNYSGGYSGTVGVSVPVVQAPTSNPGGPYSAYVSKAIVFNGSGSSDPDGYSLNYSWNFGDGTTGSGASPNHAYSSAGTFTVSLTVDDGRSVTGRASTTATLTMPPPPVITGSVTAAPNASGWNNSSVTVTFICSDANVGIRSCPSPVPVSTQGANQVVQGTATNNAGVTATGSVKVNIDETAPAITASVSPAPDSAGWNNTNVTVTFRCSDSLSGIANCPQPILVSSSGANQSVSGTATDAAGNTASTSVTLNVELTLPSIAASPSPLPNGQGWNNTNVTVSFMCTQSTSPLTSCSSPQTISTEGAGQTVTGTVSDAANNSNIAKLTLNIAKTPPTIASSLSPLPNANGWNNSAVTVTFNCTKTTAPLATCSQPQTVSTEGTNQAVTGTATDVAGNLATTTAHVSIATRPPAITATLSPQPNAGGWTNSAVTVTFTCVMTTAPIASCPQPQTVNTEGANQVVSGTVTDVAGNTSTANVTVNIALTPPKISAVPSPAPDANGWNNSSVTVSFVCTNTTAPIATCPPSQTISTEGAGQTVSGTVSDIAGNSATAMLTLNIGTKPPTILASVSPTPNAAGWNNSSVTVSFACVAGTAPIATCPSPVTLTTEGANQTVTATTTDEAGNSATTSVVMNIDETAPTLTVSSPANGATFTTASISVTGTVSDALSGVSTVTCNGVAATVQGSSFSCSITLAQGTNTITEQATDVAGNTASQSENVTFASGPTVASFSPTSAPVGTPVTVSGTNFTANGATPQVTLNQQGGGTIPAPVSSASANSLSFVVPSSATTGPITVTANGQSASSSTSLTVVASSTFTLTAAPGSATLLSGQTTTYQVSIASTNGFSQLAALTVSGIPSGITASFQPPQITAGQFSILTLTAPSAQTASSSQLTINASASVQGISQSASATVALNAQAAGNVAFAGRVAVLDPYDTPLVGLTVRFTGKNYSGASTGCTSSTTTDSSGNFQFSSLPSACGGAQLVQYDPSTVVAPAGKYSGVNLSYVLTPGQVTTPGIIVHLPRVDTAETIGVNQNSSTDQILTFKSIPNLMMVVYAGTTFSLADGTQPNPFPLSVVEIPYDRLPEKVQPDPTQDPVFAMSIEPFNSSSSQPVAVFFPNRANTSPGTTMPLTSLNPTLGSMVNYGTGTVSGDGTQIIPDLDPGFPGHQYGIVHFDWHFPIPAPRPVVYPSPDRKVPKRGDPVDPASGLLVATKTDIAFGGARGQVAITRTYRGLTADPGPFGIGTNHNYGYMLDTSSLSLSTPCTLIGLFTGCGTIRLIMPDGNQFVFVKQVDGTFMNTTVPSIRGAVISNLACISQGCAATLRWKNGATFQFQPGSGGAVFLSSITDANNNTTTLVRNQSAPMEVTQITDPVGRSLNLSYDSSFRITSITDPIGRVVRYTYNSQGTLATVTDAAGGVTSYGYDSQNRLTSITDPRGITYLQNEYDQNGKVIKQTAADGGVTTFSYTQLNPALVTTITESPAALAATAGHAIIGSAPIPNVNTSPVVLTTVTDPLGNQTTYHFNPAGFLVDVTDPLGQKTVYNVDPGTDQTASVVDPLGRVTAFVYDSAGNPLTITRLSGTPNAVTTSFTYDSNFNKVASITDPLRHQTTFKYDQGGNLLTVADPLNEQTNFTYDNVGELLTMKDALNNSMQFAYSNNDLVRITDPLGRVTARVMDQVDRLITLTNPIGQSTRYQYSPLSQVTQTTDSLGNRTLFTYDGNGNVLTVADANQHATTYTYDSMDRLSTRTDPLGRLESYQYDVDGNLTQFTDRRGVVTTYNYDALNRRTSAIFASESSINYSYDEASHLTRALDSISGAVVRSYDDLDRLISEVTPQGSVTYAYDGAGRRTGMGVSGQPAVSYVYDDGNRLAQIMQGSSGVTLGYDSDGRRTSLTLPNGLTVSYSYDPASQLTGANYGSQGNLTYSYDLAGRRTSVGGSLARTGMPNAVGSAAYNADNQVTQFGPSNLTYDANGNLINDGMNSYTWNARNQLSSIHGAVTANFQYDAFGRRVSRTIGGTTEYLYDGVNPVQELSGTTVTANLLTGLGVDQYFQRTDASGAADFLADALGSTIALNGLSGSLLGGYTYEPFGNVAISGTSTNPYQYTGRPNEGAGLYFYRARYYSATFQRFISEDPLEFADGFNRYLYAGNNPIGFSDPFGLEKKPPCPATPWNRVAAAAGGVGNVALGLAKIGLGLGVTAESGGAAVALGYYSAYSGFFNVVGGISQIYGAATGNLNAGQTGSNVASSLSSVSGIVTLAATQNAEAGATASAIEGVALVGLQGGLISTGALPAPGALDKAATGIDTGPAAVGLIAPGSTDVCQ